MLSPLCVSSQGDGKRFVHGHGSLVLESSHVAPARARRGPQRCSVDESSGVDQLLQVLERRTRHLLGKGDHRRKPLQSFSRSGFSVFVAFLQQQSIHNLTCWYTTCFPNLKLRNCYSRPAHVSLEKKELALTRQSCQHRGQLFPTIKSPGSWRTRWSLRSCPSQKITRPESLRIRRHSGVAHHTSKELWHSVVSQQLPITDDPHVHKEGVSDGHI